MAGFKLSKKAEQDLKEIYQYGYRECGEKRADKYIQELEKVFVLLAENPLLCRERIEFVPPVRIHPHNNHLIVYICRAEGILIVRLLHQSMDIEMQIFNG
jgi:toxin ParE1/3/4